MKVQTFKQMSERVSGTLATAGRARMREYSRLRANRSRKVRPKVLLVVR